MYKNAIKYLYDCIPLKVPKSKAKNEEENTLSARGERPVSLNIKYELIV